MGGGGGRHAVPQQRGEGGDATLHKPCQYDELYTAINIHNTLSEYQPIRVSLCDSLNPYCTLNTETVCG